MLEPDEITGNEPTPRWPAQQALTQENLAALLLRFLGLCFTAFGVVGVATMVGHILLLSTRFGLDDAVRRYYSFESLIVPGAQLIIGIYFLLGGQWVYDKILTPVSRPSPDDEFSRTEEDGPWRTWKSADGAYTVKAKLLRITGEAVYLLNEDGSTITVERSKLSDDDWNWAAQHAE